MEVALVSDRSVPGDHFMVVASAEEWKELLDSLDGVDHSPAALALVAEFEGWGVEKG